MLKIVLGLILLFILLACMFVPVQICGNSMYPTFKDGEFYLGKRVYRKSKCKIGKVYVFRPPYSDREERFVIKRLAYIQNGKYFFLGDNSYDSYDSRYYGYVDSKNVVAQILKEKRCEENGVQED